MAEALERNGEEVALLALFDSPLPSICDDVDLEDDARFFCDLLNFANRCAGADARIDYDGLSSLPQAEQFSAGVEEARRSGMLPPETPDEFVRKLVDVGEANVRALQSYRPSALSIAVQFFAPETERPSRKFRAARRRATTTWAGRGSSVKRSSYTTCRAIISA